MKEMLTPVTDAKGTSAYLILNPAAGSAATLLRSLTRAARERGIRVRVLEPGEEARLAALEVADDGAESLAVGGVSDLALDVVALLDHLNVRKAHVLGTSLGAS